MLRRRRVSRRHEAWIDVAKAAIAGDHLRHALLDAAKFAIPLHVAVAEVLHRAPRRIAEAAGVGGRYADAHRRRQKSGHGQCADGCHGFSLGCGYPQATRNAADAGKLTAPSPARGDTRAVAMEAAANRGLGRDLPDVMRCNVKHDDDCRSQ